MKTITNDPQDFIENGGWSFLEPDSSVSVFSRFILPLDQIKLSFNGFNVIGVRRLVTTVCSLR